MIDLTALGRAVDEANEVQLGLLAETLAALLERCRVRLAQHSVSGNGHKSRLLTAKEAAQLLGVTPRWCYERARTLPFARRPSPRTLRFDEAGLRRWADAQRDR